MFQIDISTNIEKNKNVGREEPTNEVDEIDETTRIKAVDNTVHSRPPIKKKRKEEEDGTLKMMKSAYGYLEDAAKRAETRPTVDECDSYGLFIGNKLRSYSRLTRSTVQHLFSNILFEADQGCYDIVHSKGMDERNTFGYGNSYLPRPSVTSIHTPMPSPHTSLQSPSEGSTQLSCDIISPPPQLDNQEVTAFSPLSRNTLLLPHSDDNSQDSFADFSDLV